MIIKVICGAGQHINENKSPKSPKQIENAGSQGVLKNHFLVFLTESKLDFAYIEKDGVFLIRINKAKVPNQNAIN
jgi:hypothetical protein